MSQNADKGTWVDFAEIKEKISMIMVLDHFALLPSLRWSGKNLIGSCPIHNGTNPTQFSVSTEKNVWYCFGDCGGGGNVLDFVAKIKDVSIREAALSLRDWFGGELESGKPESIRYIKEGKEQEDEFNPPLSFVLKGLKQEHPFFENRKIEPDTIKAFGLGFCSRGLMEGRIAIPIYDHWGRLVAYSGRAISQEQIEEEGRYKLPEGFVKSAVVYNLHQMKQTDMVVMVKSFTSVWWLHQAGFKAIALMDTRMSERQEELIVEKLSPLGRVVLMFDANEDGGICSVDCLDKLSSELFVKRIFIRLVAEVRKPHHLEEGILRRILL